MLKEQESAREWPARPDLTTPAAVGRATKCDNCNDSSGPQPSGHRVGAFMPCTTTSGGVTSFHLKPGESRAWTREYFENLGLYRLRGTIRYPEQPFWKREAA